MSRVLLAWELGQGLGHIDRMLMLARELRRRGHEVIFTLRDLARAHGRIAAEGFVVLQSPLWLAQMANPPRLGNYSAVLATAGWLDPEGLAGLLLGWRNLWAQLKPDLLIADHAPTALLAARGQVLPAWAVGNSFELPPTRGSFPPMEFWLEREQAQCAGYDALLLRHANRALALLGDPPLATLQDLFTPSRSAILSLPELMHYEGYDAEMPVLGASYVGDRGLAPEWPAGAGSNVPRVFAYLQAKQAGFVPLMTALKRLGWPSLVYAQGLAPQVAESLAGPQLRFAAGPVQSDAALRDADLSLNYGSVGMVSAAALAGKPQLALPIHTEQQMSAQRLQRAGLGLALMPGAPAVDHAALLQSLVADQRMLGRTSLLALQRQDMRPQASGVRVVDLLEARGAL